MSSKPWEVHISEIDTSTLIGSPTKMRNEIDLLYKELNAKKGELSSIKKQIESLDNQLSSMLEASEKIPDIFRKKAINLEDNEKKIIPEIDDITRKIKTQEQEYEESDHKKETLKYLISEMGKIDKKNLFDFRLRLSELLKRAIERIEVYSNGIIRDDENYNKLAEFIPKEDLELIKKSNNELKKIVAPFFIVYFKSGEIRYVMPNPKNPKEVFATKKWEHLNQN